MAEKSSSLVGWDKVLKILASGDLDFVVIGGAALALHGLPRTTLDIDIYINSSRKSLETVFCCLLDNLKLKSEQASLREHSSNGDLFVGQWLTFSTPDGIDIIDVFIADNNQYNSLKDTAEFIDIFSTQIKIASLPELKRMKEECGRPIDLADVALINEIIHME